MRHVLIPLDESEQSEQALVHAIETASDARVTLLTVINPSTGFSPGTGAPGAGEVWYESQKERATERLAEASEAVEARGMAVETVVETGRPQAVIVNYAEMHDIDQIIMGSHGRRGVSRLLLGSVAEKVVRCSPVPVTVVR